jgi:hypothetical protein
MKRFALPVIALLAGSLATATTLTYGSGTIHNHTDDNGKSVVTLNPDYIDSGGCCFLKLDPSQDFQNAMTKSKAAAAWAGLTFDYTGSLNGNFSIDVYNAAHTGDMTGGAQLLVRYTRGAGDPAANQLLWIQVVDTTAPNGGETIPYPDVYSGANAGSNLPFFYTPAETKLDPNSYAGQANIYSSTYKINGKGPALPYDIAFWDFPTRSATNSWRGELFLASYDAPNKKVTVYDGMSWGFDITANAPEPGTYAMIGVALLLLGLYRRKRPEMVGNRG